MKTKKEQSKNILDCSFLFFKKYFTFLCPFLSFFCLNAYKQYL